MILKLLERLYEDSTPAVLAIATVAAIWLMKARKKRIPGPMAFPLIGSLPSAFPYVRKRKTHLFFQYVAKKYGKVCSVSLGAQFIIVSDANEVTRVLNSRDFYRNNDLELSIADFVHHALFSLPSTDNRWDRHRKILQPAFGPKQLKYAYKIISEKAQSLVSLLKDKSEKGAEIIDLKPAFKALAIDIIGMVAFRHEFKCIEDLSVDYHKSSRFVKLLEKMSEIIMSRVLTPKWLWKFNGVEFHSPKVLEFSEPLDRIFEASIQERRAEPPIDTHSDSLDKDILERLLFSKNEDGDRFSDEEINGELKAFFLAGLEPTSNQLMWLVAMLCEHSEVVPKLREEIDPVLLRGGDFYDEIPKLRYLDCIVKETLRMYPVAGRIVRNAARDVLIGGYEVKKDSTIIFASQNIQMDAEYWPEPEKFIPERFLETPKPGTFTPFGAGPMNCLGEKLVLLEMKLIIMHLLYNFDVKFAPNFEATPELALTLGMPELKVQLKIR